MQDQKIHDLIGIGIGPFNLGLAALASQVPGLSCLFLDKKKNFDWHPGMMLTGARMQIPYYADLVTLADPRSPFSWLCYLKSSKRLFRFAALEQLYPTRKEYLAYCNWVAEQLDTLRFGTGCEAVTYDPATRIYTVKGSGKRSGLPETHRCRNLVIGTGTRPWLPEAVRELKTPLVFHAAEYLSRKTALLLSRTITLVGAGQSAAEIFLDLLDHIDLISELTWLVPAEWLHPMETAVSAVELQTPAYIRYFYGLTPEQKLARAETHRHLYKGINQELIRRIFERLDELGTDKVRIRTGMELVGCTSDLRLTLRHRALHTITEHQTRGLILATGYAYEIPTCIEPLRELIRWDSTGQYDVNLNYAIDKRETIFVQNAEMHTHGFNTADLSLGPYRSAVILNTILKQNRFHVELGEGFQEFGP